jgi:hypothetical protein
MPTLPRKTVDTNLLSLMNGAEVLIGLLPFNVYRTQFQFSIQIVMKSHRQKHVRGEIDLENLDLILGAVERFDHWIHVAQKHLQNTQAASGETKRRTEDRLSFNDPGDGKRKTHQLVIHQASYVKLSCRSFGV